MAEPFVDVKYNQKQLRGIARDMQDIPKQIPTVMFRGINRTVGPAKTQVTNEIAGQVRMKKSIIKKRIIQTKANRRRWEGTLDISRRRIRLIDWGAKELKRGGISYTIGRAGRSKVADAFFANVMRPGQGESSRGVFRRVGAARLPIIQLRGPSLGEVFQGSATIVQRVLGWTGKRLVIEIDKQIKYALDKWRAA